MKCKRCGCDVLIKKGDWYQCPNCGAEMFDTAVTVNDILSPTKEVERLDSLTDAAVPEKPLRKEENKSRKNPNSKSKKNTKRKKNSDAEPAAVEKSKDEFDEKQKERRRKRKENIEFFTPIVLAFVVALLLKTLVFANAVVPTGSMLNTIHEGDRIVASRLAYINDVVERYDVIIFKFPDDESQKFVKRVIGLPGETVQIIDGAVYIKTTDGHTIKAEDSFITNCVPKGNYGPYLVPADSYFVMGDNRNNSIDSRFWDNKYVHKDKILGEVRFRYYPSVGKIE